MANVRDLKKDIDYLFFEFISDCFLFTSLHEGEKQEAARNLIEEAVAMRNDFIDRVNSPDGKDNPRLVKAYYSTLRKDLLSEVDSCFEKLSSLTKPQ